MQTAIQRQDTPTIGLINGSYGRRKAHICGEAQTLSTHARQLLRALRCPATPFNALDVGGADRRHNIRTGHIGPLTATGDVRLLGLPVVHAKMKSRLLPRLFAETRICSRLRVCMPRDSADKHRGNHPTHTAPCHKASLLELPSQQVSHPAGSATNWQIAAKCKSVEHNFHTLTRIPHAMIPVTLAGRYLPSPTQTRDIRCTVVPARQTARALNREPSKAWAIRSWRSPQRREFFTPYRHRERPRTP